MSKYYIMEDKKTVPCDLMTWAKMFEGNRHVADETIGGARVSTVFLGLDHSFCGGRPLLFETMVFGGALDQEQERCSTWDEAEKMHAAMVERVKATGDHHAN